MSYLFDFCFIYRFSSRNKISDTDNYVGNVLVIFMIVPFHHCLVFSSRPMFCYLCCVKIKNDRIFTNNPILMFRTLCRTGFTGDYYLYSYHSHPRGPFPVLVCALQPLTEIGLRLMSWRPYSSDSIFEVLPHEFTEYI